MAGPDGWRVLDNLAAAAQGRIITRKPVVAGPEEVAANPRSRSAKLRVFEKSGGPAAEASSSGRQRSSKKQRQQQPQQDGPATE